MTTKQPRKFDFDRTYQAKLVRALFQKQDETRDIIDHLDPALLDTEPMRWTLGKLKRYLAKHGTSVTVTVLEHEAVKDARIGNIKDSHVDAFAKFISRLGRDVPDRTYILDRAYDYVRYVSAREFTIQLAEQLQQGEVDWTAVNQALDHQRRFGDRMEGGLGQDFFTDTVARVKRRKEIEDSGIPTLIAVIDEKMRQGGLPRKQLGVIIAPPGRGKTAMLVFIAGSAVLCGFKVLYITLELAEDVIAERFDSRFSGIRINSLGKKPVTLKRKLQAIVDEQPGAGLRIKEFPPMQLTVEGLRSYLRRLETVSFYPDIIFIDYVDNMDFDQYRGRGGDGSDYTPLGRLYTATRGLAVEHNIPIWTASQSNRLSIDKKEIGIVDLADSFKKAAVADVMVAIAQKKVEIGRKVARLCMAKNRNGRAGTVDLVRFDMAHVLVGDV